MEKLTMIEKIGLTAVFISFGAVLILGSFAIYTIYDTWNQIDGIRTIYEYTPRQYMNVNSYTVEPKLYTYLSIKAKLDLSYETIILVIDGELMQNTTKLLKAGDRVKIKGFPYKAGDVWYIQPEEIQKVLGD